MLGHKYSHVCMHFQADCANSCAVYYVVNINQMQQTLEKEIEMLKLSRRELEQYVERTDMWCEFAGKWRIDICSSNVSITI